MRLTLCGFVAVALNNACVRLGVVECRAHGLALAMLSRLAG